MAGEDAEEGCMDNEEVYEAYYGGGFASIFQFHRPPFTRGRQQTRSVSAGCATSSAVGSFHDIIDTTMRGVVQEINTSASGGAPEEKAWKRAGECKTVAADELLREQSKDDDNDDDAADDDNNGNDAGAVVHRECSHAAVCDKLRRKIELSLSEGKEGREDREGDNHCGCNYSKSMIQNQNKSSAEVDCIFRFVAGRDSKSACSS
jgi:hypothetical protein